jgi:CRISPR-associated exonuclease Cas4
MNLPVEAMAAAAVAALVLGLLLVLAGRGARRSRGLGQGATVALDNVTLISRRYGLTGRIDRLIRQGGAVIPEEWKSSRRVWPSHRAQMGVYFLLIEAEMNVRPPHGFIVTGDGRRHRIDNDERLRAWVLKLRACQVHFFHLLDVSRSCQFHCSHRSRGKLAPQSRKIPRFPM